MAPTTTDTNHDRVVPMIRDDHHAQQPSATKTKRTQHRKREEPAMDPKVTPHAKRLTDQVVDHPPPPYTPTIALHASTIPYDSAYAGPSSTSAPTVPAVAAVRPHGSNVGFLVGAVLAGLLLLLAVGLLGRYCVRRKAGQILRSHPRFSMLQPRQGPKYTDEHPGNVQGKARAPSGEFGHELGQFVYISTSDGELDAVLGKDDDEHEHAAPYARDGLHPDDHPDAITRRYSSPAALGDHDLKASASSIDICGMSASRSAPASPNMTSSLDRDTSLWLQRQKAAELAQIVRMRIVREEMPVHKALSCPDFQLDEKRASSVSLNHGLGIVREDQEVDIASTAISALHSYSIAVDPMSPNIPVTNFFQIDKEGRVVRLPGSPLTPGTNTFPTTPLSPSSSSGGSSFSSEGDTEESAVIVQMAQARSMEIKRATLVSMNLQSTPPASRSAPMLLDAQSAAKDKTAFPTPPPSLSPIVTSPTSLSADIEHTLEARVFAYRDSGAWSKQSYKLTTPGQVRALAESLAIARPTSVYQQTERGWPWPAHRSGVVTD